MMTYDTFIDWVVRKLNQQPREEYGRLYFRVDNITDYNWLNGNAPPSVKISWDPLCAMCKVFIEREVVNEKCT